MCGARAQCAIRDRRAQTRFSCAWMVLDFRRRLGNFLLFRLNGGPHARQCEKRAGHGRKRNLAAPGRFGATRVVRAP
ncbi:hypothetical protein CN225_27885 [Sinorhizobium meliloti]|nr:hypothetical protein CN225_27885 [Sinorhizobium meliloti]